MNRVLREYMQDLYPFRQPLLSEDPEFIENMQQYAGYRRELRELPDVLDDIGEDINAPQNLQYVRYLVRIIDRLRRRILAVYGAGALPPTQGA